MKIRGERECSDCGTRWSYYETGDVHCPACGSVRSQGVGDRAAHTDGPASLDLTAAKSAIGDDSLDAAAAAATDACRDYLAQRGFVDAGTLRDLDDAFLAAAELRHAASMVRSRLALSDPEEEYFLALVEGAADGNRPEASSVPRGMRAARGLGSAAAVRTYREDLRTWLDEHGGGGGDGSDDARSVRGVLESLDAQVKRIRALDGDVDPETADRLVQAARDVGRGLRDGDDDRMDAARTALDSLA